MFEIDIGSLDQKKLRMLDVGVLTGADFDGDVLSTKTFIDIDGLRKQFMEDNKMARKITITLIGSMKNKEIMMEIYNKLTFRGNYVMLPYMDVIPEDADMDAIDRLHSLHRDKMMGSDLIIVVDTNGYIGKDTREEIKFCEDHGKIIIYASDLDMLVTTQPAKSKK